MTKNEKKEKVPTGNTGTRARIHEDKKSGKVIGKREKATVRKKDKK